MTSRVHKAQQAGLPPLTDEEIGMLWRGDKLRLEMKDGDAFAGYKEGEASFGPTYMLDRGKSKLLGEHPAWADRILWESTIVTQTAYDAVYELMLSDHRPVYATFEVAVESQVAIDTRTRYLQTSSVSGRSNWSRTNVSGSNSGLHPSLSPNLAEIDNGPLRYTISETLTVRVLTCY